jgi:hypothetical protein
MLKYFSKFSLIYFNFVGLLHAEFFGIKVKYDFPLIAFMHSFSVVGGLLSPKFEDQETGAHV